MTSVLASEGAGPAYRPDIDGLRAVAVLAVVANHAWPGLLPGGFFGVDVFFVISGYLITVILVRERNRGLGGLLNFYARRVRRILPALAVMLVATTAVALALLTPQDLELFGRSLASVASLSSNRFFLSLTGYFSPEAANQPLLHTWSLSIEEQFYLFWPAAVLALFHTRTARFAPWAIAGLALLSFAEMGRLSVLGGADEAFYYLRSRLWELLLGAWLATAPVHRISQRWRGMLGCVGTVGIALGLSPIGGGAAWPGVAALAPCLGAALIIAGQGAGPVGHALSSRPLVGVGLISYSLYLWHWPALSLPTLVLSRGLTPGEASLAVGGATVVAWLSWRWVERPFRRMGGARPARTILVGLILLALLWTVGALLHRTQGLPGRAASGVLIAQTVAQVQPPTNARCHMPDGVALPPQALCTLGPVPASVIVWGDSHAGHLVPLVARLAEMEGFGLRHISRSACPPIVLSGTGPLCAAFDASALEELKRSRPRVVILSARWVEYVRWNHGDVDTFQGEVRRGLGLLRRELGPDAVLVIWGPTPDFDVSPTLCWARAAQARLSTGHCERMSPKDPSLVLEVERVLRAEATGVDARVVTPFADMCRGRTCRTIGERGEFLYRDDDHLSLVGAEALMPLLAPSLAGLSARAPAPREP